MKRLSQIQTHRSRSWVWEAGTSEHIRVTDIDAIWVRCVLILNICNFHPKFFFYHVYLRSSRYENNWTNKNLTFSNCWGLKVSLKVALIQLHSEPSQPVDGAARTVISLLLLNTACYPTVPSYVACATTSSC